MGVFTEAQEDVEQRGWAHLKYWFETGQLQTVVQEVFLPYAQQPFGVGQGTAIVVRGTGDPSALGSVVRAEVTRVDAELPAYALRPMDELLDKSIAQRRFQMLLLVLFAALATSLAAVGFYGVIAYSVGRRTAEFGIRMALGAERESILRLVVGQGMRLVISAVALGVLGALAAGQVLSSLLFGISARDPLTYGAVTTLLVAAALLACWIPARRASAR